MGEKLKVVMLAGRDESSNILYHALKEEFDIECVVMEAPVSKAVMLKRRMRRLGVMKVIGQLLFIVWHKLTSGNARKRIDAIKKAEAMNDAPIESERVSPVASVNDDAVIAMLQASQCDAVVVNGTRIIAEKVLKSVTAPFINIHAGITPKYRGVHGGYWALAQNDAAHCGVTVHLVDAGIDTGEVLYQARIAVTDKDSFSTYPYLQLAEGIPLMRVGLRDVFEGKLSTHRVELASRLWYHPTLFEYGYYFMTKRVK